jgi:hypothetical protein
VAQSLKALDYLLQGLRLHSNAGIGQAVAQMGPQGRIALDFRQQQRAVDLDKRNAIM